MRPIALATCAQVPDLDEDGPAIVAALRELAIEAVPVVWDDPGIDSSAYEAVVVRSTWDYAERIDEFLAWAERVHAATRLINSFATLRWNTDKTYLRELAEQGLPVVPTTFVRPGDRFDLPADDEYVIKPAISAGSRATARYVPTDNGKARAHAQSLFDEGRTVMLQPYLAAVDERGEADLVYIGGAFSHAARKGPILASGADPIDGLYAAEEMSPLATTPEERSVADDVISTVQARFGTLAYARVDLVHTPAGDPMVLEVELTEPSLFLAQGPPDGAQRFAATLARQLGVGS